MNSGESSMKIKMRMSQGLLKLKLGNKIQNGILDRTLLIRCL